MTELVTLPSEPRLVACREAAAPVEAQTAKEVHQLPVGPDENLPFLLDDDPGKAGEQQKTELTFAPVPAPPPLSIEPTNHTVQWYQPDAPPISIPYRSDTGVCSCLVGHST